MTPKIRFNRILSHLFIIILSILVFYIFSPYFAANLNPDNINGKGFILYTFRYIFVGAWVLAVIHQFFYPLFLHIDIKNQQIKGWQTRKIQENEQIKIKYQPLGKVIDIMIYDKITGKKVITFPSYRSSLSFADLKHQLCHADIEIEEINPRFKP